MAQNDKYTRIYYVRYADDFIIGIEGSYDLAKFILEKVTHFVETELRLEFNPDKTGITNYVKEPIKFLGYTLAASHLKGSVKQIESIKVHNRTIMRRKKTRIKKHLDKMKLISRLVAKGMIRKRTSHAYHDQLVYRGRYIGNLINLDHVDILRYYNSVVRGIHNYYDIADNRNYLLYII